MNSPLAGVSLVVGIRQTIRAVELNKVGRIYVANDAESRVVESLIQLCKAKGVEVIFVDSREALGKAAGIERGASAIAVLR
ncbi:MAG: ribosomal L7Ae/L30e/S12e/Gadd45 family protein [bacterium]|nr:ribosomal L7Ae/L30e/S12e/Gadd45 family protein [Coprothermobacterota bacterium]